MIARRRLLRGMLAMPAIIRTPGLLMAIKPVCLDEGGYRVADYLTDYHGWFDVSVPGSTIVHREVIGLLTTGMRLAATRGGFELWVPQ